MIFLDMDYIKWAKEKGIEIKNIECSKCNKRFTTNKPFVTKNYYGLLTSEHECGKKYRSFVYVHKSYLKDLESKEKIRNILKNIK